MADQIDIKISEDLVRPIIETKINQAIVAGMGDFDKVIAKVASTIINHKVDGDGKPERYSSRDNLTYIEWLSKRVIQEAAESAMKEWAEERKPEIQKELVRQMSLKKTTNVMVKAMVDGFITASQEKYRYKFKLELEEESH